MTERESSRFCDAISYGLAPEFVLKDEQNKVILAVYEGKGHLCEPPTNWLRKENLLSNPPLCV